MLSMKSEANVCLCHLLPSECVKTGFCFTFYSQETNRLVVMLNMPGWL